MKKKLFTLLILMLMLVLSIQPAFAATYRFQVKTSTVDVVINSDGTMTIEYTLEFLNDNGVSPIDYVDIGTPNDNFNLGAITAEIDGQPIQSIEKSEYVDHGFALGLGSMAIPAGQSGRVHVTIPSIEKVIYPGTAKESEDYASFEFSPNFFGSQYCYGTTDMVVTLTLPTGMNDQEPRYFEPKKWPGDIEPYSDFDNQDRIFYRWTSASANSYTEYIFGASFPARLIPSTAIVRAPLINISGEDVCCTGFFLVFAAVFGLGIYQSIWGVKKRKMQYLPPKISIEGHGIKRGLTAVEAAVLMEQPIDKVMTMLLFSVIKKGAAKVTTREPLKLEIISPQPEGLNPYEVDFLTAFMDTSKAEQRTVLQTTIINLVKSVTEKMRGFSRKESIEYYENIIKRAWETVQQAETPDVKMQKFDEYMGWTMMDKDFDNRTQDVFRTGPVFMPTWWGRFDPAYGHTQTSTPVSTSTSPAGGGSVSMPSLPGSEFAASMVGGIQSFANNVVGEVTSFTEGITNKTNPVPKPTTTSSRSGRSGGGGGCACACACAGCACACAGGGR